MIGRAAQAIRETLLRWSRLLGNVPSLFYAMLYLLAIPVFAREYANRPEMFYHSTIKFDPAGEEAEREARHAVEAYLKGAMDSLPRPTVGNYTVRPDAQSLSLDDYEPYLNYHGQVVFSMMVYGDSGEYYSGRRMRITMPHFPHSPLEVALPYPGHDSLRFIAWGNALINGYRVTNANALPDSVQAAMQRYSLANRGFGGYTRSYWSRAMYLSAVTITTLGYGDIVPITETTRRLVSVEAVLGVVLVGLFLNSLALESASQPTSNPPSDPAPPPPVP